MFGCLGKIALGLAVGGFVTLGGCALVMSSCTVGLGGVASRALEGIDTEEAVEAFDHGLERLGTLVLASPTRLDGELDRSEDGYSGRRATTRPARAPSLAAPTSTPAPSP